MTTRIQLQNRVHEVLRDYNRTRFNPLEVQRVLNYAQDIFTRDSGYLRGTNAQNITAGTARYTLTPATGYRIGRVISAQLHDGNGAVASVTVSAGGSSYTSAPTVTIADPTSGTTATATATVASNAVTAVTLSVVGTGYTAPPAVTFSGGGGSGAAAFAILAGSDDTALIPMTVEEMLASDPDWRRRTSSRPTHYVRNYDDGVLDTARNESLRLYPIPDTSYTVGLRVAYTLATDGQMSADTTASALPERIADEALVNYTVAELLSREALREPKSATIYLQQAEAYRARWMADLNEAASEANSGYDSRRRRVRAHWV